MKVRVEEIGLESEEELIVKCHAMTNELFKIIESIKIINKGVLGYEGQNIHRVMINEVYYFETVDNKSFIYCKDKVFESKQKLYELEELCDKSKFFRASKSTIVNVTKVSYIRPILSGRFEANLDNGEKVIVSRQYVPILKQLLEL